MFKNIMNLIGLGNSVVTEINIPEVIIPEVKVKVITPDYVGGKFICSCGGSKWKTVSGGYYCRLCGAKALKKAA